MHAAIKHTSFYFQVINGSGTMTQSRFSFFICWRALEANKIINKTSQERHKKNSS